MSFTHDDYTIAWICALPLEMAAAKAMLDEVHTHLPQPRTDHNVYTLGTISNHNIVVACLPSGVYGTISASNVVSHMTSTFPNIRFGLMVGIAGGVPGTPADIRLGDVVVSKPTAISPGVVQYDYGKTLREGKMQRTGSLNKPPQVLLKAVSQMESDYLVGKRPLNSLIAETKINDQFRRPESDILFESTYDHEEGESNCSACDRHRLVDRPLRKVDEPYIHYGVIASGDQVMKAAQTRDSIAQELNVLCFEMEAAGIMDELPSLVIRGICDYCDSHKHKEWQGYPALTAAAYAKLLLSTVPVLNNAGNKNRKFQKGEFTTEEKRCLQNLFLTDPVDDKNALRRRKGDRAEGTAEWISETEEITHWLETSETGGKKESDILWLYGNPGIGKSTMAMTLTEELPKQSLFAGGNKVLGYFFCDSSNDIQRTVIAILRGLIYHLVKQRPVLMKILFSKYEERKERLFTSFDALWAILMNMGQEHSVEVYCIIDALDECDSDSQQILLQQIYQTYWSDKDTKSSARRPHILITSRPYFEIRNSLRNFRNRDLASYRAVKNDLKIMIEEKVKDLAGRKRYTEQVTKEVSRILEEKAEGTFLWVGIACNELGRPEVQSRNVVKILGRMPRGLHALYRQLLKSALVNSDENDEDDKKTIVDILRFVAFARRPLTVLELSDLCQLYPDYDQASRLQFAEELIGLCRLMIVIRDKNVQLLHKSVKDFLVEEDLGIGELEAHADMATRSIDYIMDRNEWSIVRDPGLLRYAIKFWPVHAGHAGTKFVVIPHQVRFFEPVSEIWAKWVDLYDAVTPVFGGLHAGFTALHAAARWNLLPLLMWELKARAGSAELACSNEKIYNDADFRTKSGVTPLEEAARGGHRNVMEILLERLQIGLKVSHRVIEAAAQNESTGTEIMRLLLDRQKDQIQITEYVITAAMKNAESGKNILTLLLDRHGDQIEVTRTIVKAMMRNWKTGRYFLMLLLDRREDGEQIAKDVVKAVAGNAANAANNILPFLFGRQGEKIQITEELLDHTIGNASFGKDVLSILVDERGNQTQIFQDIMKVAASHETDSIEFLENLNHLGGVDFCIPRDVFLAAASCGNDKTLQFLAQVAKQPIPVPLLEIAQLYNAAKCGDIYTIQRLLHQGVPPDTKSHLGISPLWIASAEGHEDIVQALVETKQVDLNVSSRFGRSALAQAVARNEVEVVRVLLREHADPDIADINGMTLYEYSWKRGYWDIAQLFEEYDLNKLPLSKGPQDSDMSESDNIDSE